jgi:hypothetical protein
MTEPTDTPPADETAPRCTWCERSSGLILLVGAIGLAYIGLDLLTGGWLSRALVGAASNAADAIDVPAGTEGVSSEPATST